MGWPHDELAARLGRSSAGLRRSKLSNSVTAQTARDTDPDPQHTEHAVTIDHIDEIAI